MYENVDYLELVKQARLGNQEGMDCLAKLAEGRVCAYLYKLTMDYDLAQDLSQETLLEMVESLKNLKQPDRFWAWLFRTALGKAQLYFRDRQRQHAIRMSVLEKERLVQLNSSADNDGLSKMIRKELSEAIRGAMAKLKFSHRNVLILRCFEQMSYSEIANIIDRSELQTHALFFRAKRSLKRQLARDGFGKGWLLVALGVFARLTTPAKASLATVTAASTKVGLAGTILGAAGTKLGVAVTTTVVVAAFTVGGITTVNNNSTSAPLSKGLGKTAFEYPSSLVAAYDADNSGWEGRGIRSRGFVVPEQWLVGPPPSRITAVSLPTSHWVELEFSGEIINGPGDDIIIIELGQYGEQARVFITDSAGKEYLLGIATSGIAKQSPEFRLTEIGFDISDISLPFVPCAVRIVGIDNKGSIPGFELCNVRARITSN
jgi:RNA polymerase sigma-70 factor (ECF subfamily)